MKKSFCFILLFLIFFNLILSEGFAPGTLIKTPNGYKPIEILRGGDFVYAWDFSSKELVQSRVWLVLKQKTSLRFKFDVYDESLIADGEQKIFLFDQQKWCKVKNLLQSSLLLQAMDHSYQVELLRKNDDVADVYLLILEKPHNFFVTKSDILVHNFIPIAIGFTWVFGGEVAVSIGAAIAAGLGIAYTRGKHKNEISIEPFDQYGFSGTPGGPNNNKNKWKIIVQKMEDFFNKTKVGRRLQKSSRKTKKRYHGQTVYQLEENVPEYSLKKGDQYYLDNLHKDHLEVFDKRGNFAKVLNLDGTGNMKKYLQAKLKGRYLS